MILFLSWLAFASEGVVVPGTGAAIEFDASAEAEVAAALALMNKGDFDEASRRLGALADASSGTGLRTLEAIACLEAAWMVCAERATRLGLAAAPADRGLLAARGAVLVELGRGDEARPLLDRVAQTGPDDGVRAAAIVDRGAFHLDSGNADAAERDLVAGRDLARRLGLNALAARAEADLGLVASLRAGAGASDMVGRVSEAVARGDLMAAKLALPPDAADARSKIQRSIALGVLARAEGRLDESGRWIEQAGADARSRGLVRERALALGQAAVTYTVTGNWPVARDRLEEALNLVGGGSMRVMELSLRTVAGRVSARLGDLEGARRHAASAQTLAAGIGDPSGRAGAKELAGLVHAVAGDTAAAVAAYDAAIALYQEVGAVADAGRVAVERVEAVAAGAPGQIDAAAADARALLAAAKDPLAAVHVYQAEGLGRARAGDLEGALRAFGAAGDAAEAIGGPAAKRLGELARQNAASALANLTGSATLMEAAKGWGLEELVARHGKYEAARAAYDGAVAAFGAGDFDAAYDGFDRAMRDLDAIGEATAATRARRSRAWSEYNLSVGYASEDGLPIWQRLVEEGVFVSDPELRVRAMGSAAVAKGELGRSDALPALRAAANESERMGLRAVAGSCQASLAELEPTLGARVAAARRAFALRDGDRTGVYAMYAAAVSAVNEGDPATARALAEAALPKAGELKGALNEVLAAAR